MATIFYAEPELVIGHNRKILFVNPNDLQIFKEIELPTDLLSSCGLKSSSTSTAEQQSAAAETGGGSVVEGEEPKDTKTIEAGASASAPTVSVQNVSYSPDRQLLAVTTAGQKALVLYKCRPEHAQLVSVRALARASSAIRFAADSSSVLVTDKTGDCYQYDCIETEALPRLLLGHLSIVYDILWTGDQQHIITSDRDDKIRVTNYPATFDIHSYCLGHKEFVSGLALLSDEHICSVSGDKTLRVWNFKAGKELLRTDLPAPAVRLHHRQLPQKSDGDNADNLQRHQLGILFYDHVDAVGLYELEGNGDVWSVTVSQQIRADAGSWNICNFALTEERVYVMGAKDERLTFRCYNSSNGEPITSQLPEGWLTMILDQFPGDAGSCLPEDLSVWFKKRFDNVSDYLERKKRRIEEQQQQHKC
ncbi:uncharacterized protein Dwil_GK25232 [Drosophila willistoni]|uniref:tRNA (guanine-N(7)-)-methyltransferase non-catalytic subunit wuho n=1 Tax=Drosophila willistoni TaxID=7260 RepID=WUHO_DROWI|nr:tRNA (guanine-N(7)-)-methyltransferase non-catalytic subunit wuho [Drosophila willistoni]B4NER4.1 RecName: Full=tRNA (guanine-N(7)-)-methyltransferase non-catalytic subunit wuho [Drosophila willistoni]EDW82233.1 uncharacterized protein Dwil_GK25232 [Drosophila willistoni]